jgi:peptidoglycan/xylan/chitin deacetylase (PgdA/CDA1 family)
MAVRTTRLGRGDPVMRRLKRHVRVLVRRAACALRPCAVVLAYHHVSTPGHTAPWLTVPPQQFEQHMAYLSRSGLAASLDELLSDLRRGRPSRRGRVLVTFDDAAADTFHTAGPILARQAIPFTVFVPTGLVGSGRPLWWNRLYVIAAAAGARGFDLPDYVAQRCPEVPRGASADTLWRWLRLLDDARRDRLLDDCAARVGADVDSPAANPMTWDEIHALDRGGLVTWGAHTVTHPMLGALSTDRVRAELLASRETLHALRSPRNVLAFPYGDPAAVEPAMDTVREAGFEVAFTTREQPVRCDEDRLQLGRVCIDATPLDEFRWMIDTLLMN